MHALRPAANGRQASRAMGSRLVKTWRQLRPSPMLDEMLTHGAEWTLPVGFGSVCAASGIDARSAVEGFIYTRLASTVSAAMRLMAIGQHEAHAVLSGALSRAPVLVERIAADDLTPSMFGPAFDIAAMSQQYVHSRLFRS
jgi:urease accessory protein